MKVFRGGSDVDSHLRSWLKFATIDRNLIRGFGVSVTRTTSENEISNRAKCQDTSESGRDAKRSGYGILQFARSTDTG